MKNLLLILILFLTFTSLNAQAVVCGNTSITISDVVCLDQDTPDPSDDFLKFTVTGSNIESDEIQQLPMNTTVESMSSYGFDPMSGDLDLYGDGPFCITSESSGCSPLVLLVDIYDENSDMNCEEFRTVGIAGIPTLGQWGIMILGLMVVVFGIINIRNKVFLPETA